METSASRAKLLALLGFTPGARPSQTAIEEARTKLCGMLQLPDNSTDDMILDVAQRMGYQPGASSDAAAKPKPAADASELASIKTKRTISGLSGLSSMRTTQTGVKPLHSRGTGANPSGDHISVERDEAAQQEPAPQQSAAEQAAEKHRHAQALRTSAQFKAIGKEQSIWQKIALIFKKNAD